MSAQPASPPAVHSQALDEIKIGGMGASRKRVEDDRFIRGQGNFWVL